MAGPLPCGLLMKRMNQQCFLAWRDGTAQSLVLDRSPKPQIEIRSEWHERIQPVTTEEARKILLGGDYFLRLYVGRLPDGSPSTEYEQTGLKWPE